MMLESTEPNSINRFNLDPERNLKSIRYTLLKQ